MSATSRHPKLLVTAFVALLALLVPAACGDDSAETSSSAAEAGADSDGGANGDNGDDTTTTEAPTTTTTETAPPATGEACLIGKWQVDNDQWGQMFQAFADAEAGEGFQVLGVTGVGTTEFRADGTTETVYDEWTITAAMEGAPGDMAIVRTGVDHGTWSTDGGNVKLVETEITSGVTVSMGGMVLPGGADVSHDPELIADDAAFDCRGDVLSITVDGASWAMHRVG